MKQLAQSESVSFFEGHSINILLREGRALENLGFFK